MRKIAIYGKGGIGKTTVASNLSVLFARSGAKVLQIGCDPKHDSCYKLVDRRDVVTVMGLLREHRDSTVTRDDFVMEGSFGVRCVETGGPEPGVGCAGRGITRMFEILEITKVLDEGHDVVIYDVLGDVVCGGFAAPIRGGFAEEVLIVASGEVMALYAANNICRAVVRHRRAGATVAGVVANMRSVPGEEQVLRRFAETVNVRLFHPIPQDPLVQEAERSSKTVSEYAPDADVASHYKSLFEEIRGHDQSEWERRQGLPNPMDDAAFDAFVTTARSP